MNADLAVEDDMATAQAVSESDAASSPGVAAAIAQVSNSTNWNKSQDSWGTEQPPADSAKTGKIYLMKIRG